ncbi:aldo/keto reductase [Bordetella sp. BOR01]|uniref:aldo/keto reductase n=1 Tax=Bordetella sp. BOR01 TaxID=2854779 RepID=UPI001C45E9D3|nr:aldo/keto reductase [Bordetella sp. BOR01]MBV7486002.1 aldo/keto reductase [Bordetella sp. BOR01]
MTRARFLRLAAGAAGGAALARLGPATASAAASPLPSRSIPVSGEPLPIVGCGTYRGFDVDVGSTEYQELADVLSTLFAAGGSVLDSSPMYGRAEAVTGQLLAASNSHARAFLAAKVWTQGRSAGITQMEDSFKLLRTPRIDLMQIHNLLDWRTHLPVLRDWQAQGRLRYVGITHYTASAYDDVEAVLRAERLDFLQINYSADDRAAEQRLLPLAAERGVAVLVNRPFGGGGLLRRMQGRPLPAWAAEIGAASWPQLLLKFVLSHAAVTCAIPGTGRAAHMRDNLAAAIGPLPDRAFWTPHLPEMVA